MNKILSINKSSFRRARRVAAITSIILLIGLLPIAALTLRDPQKTEAAWFNDNWAYRQIITVTNNGSTQTNYRLGP